MVEAFAKMRTSSMLGGVVYKDLNKAMLDVSAKSWTGPLIARLEPEMTRPKDNKDPSAFDSYRDLRDSVTQRLPS